MQIARVFFDVNMQKNFDGLLKVCHKEGFKPEAQKESYVVFINKAKTRFKLLVNNTYLIYHDNGTRRFPLDAIQYLPQAFKGETFDFSKSIEKTLLDKMRK